MYVFTQLANKFRGATHPEKLLQSVCSIGAVKNDKFFVSNGVFLRPDVILCTRHTLKDATQIVIKDIFGNSATVAQGDPANKLNRDLDISAFRITRPLKGYAPPFAHTDEGLRDTKGFLATRYDEIPAVYGVGLDTRYSLQDFQMFKGTKRSYICDHEMAKGYSGSPIFDAAGRLSSILTSVLEIRVTGKEPDFKSFVGPVPHHLAGFIKEVIPS